MNNMLKLITAFLLLLPIGTALQAAGTKNPYSAAITVNDRIITGYEISQREQMLIAFGARVDARETAIDQLINERLYQQAAKSLNITVNAADIEAGMDEFAQRGNLTSDQLIQYLAARKIDRTTFEAFVENGLLWRQVVRAKFANQARTSDQDLDNVLGTSSEQGQLSVRLAELIIPHLERGPDGAAKLAKQLSKSIKSNAAFSSAARRYSRASSARKGGLLDWLPVGNLPPSVVGQVLALNPGEVSDPIELNGATAIFQLRGTRRDKTKAGNATVVYNTVTIPKSVGDRKTQVAAARVLINRSDRCLDLRANARKYGEKAYAEESGAQSSLSSSVALELAKLDANEASYYDNAAGNVTVVMLCSRIREFEEGERDELRNSLFTRKISGLGAGYLQELRGSARIIHK